jgi:hypothetical protein
MDLFLFVIMYDLYEWKVAVQSICHKKEKNKLPYSEALANTVGLSMGLCHAWIIKPRKFIPVRNRPTWATAVDWAINGGCLQSSDVSTYFPMKLCLKIDNGITGFIKGATKLEIEFL